MFDEQEAREKREERQRQEAEEKVTLARRATKLQAWLHHQSARLGLSCAEILAAVKRGWPGNAIADTPAADAHVLAGPPANTLSNFE